jgi:DnaJ-class molecular chaperone
MEGKEEATESCPKCGGRGKYADPSKALVSVTCDLCGGSGEAPEGGGEGGKPIDPPKKVEWQFRRHVD